MDDALAAHNQYGPADRLEPNIVAMLMTYTHLAADDLKRAHATRSPLDNL